MKLDFIRKNYKALLFAAVEVAAIILMLIVYRQEAVSRMSAAIGGEVVFPLIPIVLYGVLKTAKETKEETVNVYRSIRSSK